MHACVPLLLPARAPGDPDAAAGSGDVPLPLPMGDHGDGPGTMQTDLGLEHGEKADLKVLFGSESSPVEALVEPGEPSAREVLRDFIKNNMEDGTTPFDAAIDADPY